MSESWQDAADARRMARDSAYTPLRADPAPSVEPLTTPYEEDDPGLREVWTEGWQAGYAARASQADERCDFDCERCHEENE